MFFSRVSFILKSWPAVSSNQGIHDAEVEGSKDSKWKGAKSQSVKRTVKKEDIKLKMKVR